MSRQPFAGVPFALYHLMRAGAVAHHLACRCRTSGGVGQAAKPPSRCAAESFSTGSRRRASAASAGLAGGKARPLGWRLATGAPPARPARVSYPNTVKDGHRAHRYPSSGGQPTVLERVVTRHTTRLRRRMPPAGISGSQEGTGCTAGFRSVCGWWGPVPPAHRRPRHSRSRPRPGRPGRSSGGGAPPGRPGPGPLPLRVGRRRTGGTGAGILARSPRPVTLLGTSLPPATGALPINRLLLARRVRLRPAKRLSAASNPRLAGAHHAPNPGHHFPRAALQGRQRHTRLPDHQVDLGLPRAQKAVPRVSPPLPQLCHRFPLVRAVLPHISDGLPRIGLPVPPVSLPVPLVSLAVALISLTVPPLSVPVLHIGPTITLIQNRRPTIQIAFARRLPPRTKLISHPMRNVRIHNNPQDHPTPTQTTSIMPAQSSPVTLSEQPAKTETARIAQSVTGQVTGPGSAPPVRRCRAP
jgi:hypothetical protein